MKALHRNELSNAYTTVSDHQSFQGPQNAFFCLIAGDQNLIDGLQQVQIYKYRIMASDLKTSVVHLID